MPDRELLFIGTYTESILFGTGDILPGKGKGIHIMAVDGAGKLTSIGLAPNVRNPSFLCLSRDRRFLYAVNELKEYNGAATGAVSAFAVTWENGTATLSPLNIQPTGGTDPCHVAVNQVQTHVFVSNFMSGSVCVLPIRSDGSLGPASDFIQYEGHSAHPRRQASPHAHSLIFDRAERRAFVPDLGTDKLMVYRTDFTAGKLIPEKTPFFATEPGDGPRFLEFHPNQRWCYLINEIGSSVSLLSYDEPSGRFEKQQTVATIPSGFSGDNICADLHLTPDGKYLYASNRGHNSLARFRVNPGDGKLEPLGNISCGGRTPRNFAVSASGKFLLVANQDSDNLLSFRIDYATGDLQKIDEIFAPTPVCVLPIAL